MTTSSSHLRVPAARSAVPVPVPVSAAPAAPPASRSGRSEAQRSIRGSSGMMIGYGMSLVVGFVIQVLLARYLGRDQFGAFAWALSAVLLVQSVLPIGLDRANARFLALYDERGDYRRLAGFFALAATLVGATATLLAALLLAFSQHIAGLAPSPLAERLLLVLVALAPVQVVDGLVVDLFAVMGSAVAVFVRRYLLEPGLRLAVVAVMLLSHRNAGFLAFGYLGAGTLAMLIYVALAVRLVRGLAIWRGLPPPRDWPWRPVLAFCGPVFLTSFVATGTTEVAVVVLGRTAGADAVASIRAVQPFAFLNVAVMFSFTTLFTPNLSRLAARGALAEVRDLYWLTASYIAVLTFPILAVLAAFPVQVVLTTLGPAYRSSALPLVILSLGYYVNAALGFNGLSIQVLGRSTWVMVTNLVTLGGMAGMVLVLVPALGSTGAALAVLGTLVLHNGLKQCGLGFGAGVGIVQRDHLMILVWVALLVLALAAFDALDHPPLWVAVPLVGAAWLVLLVGNRRNLRFLEFFPELARTPLKGLL